MGIHYKLLCSLSLAFLLNIVPTESIPQNDGHHPIPSQIPSMPCTRNQDCTSKFRDTDCRNGQFCQCQKGFVEDFNQCLRINQDLESECEINAQCAEGLGRLSRCSETEKKCECYDTIANGRNATGFYGHYCYIRKELGQRCALAEECKASLGPAEDVSCDVRTRTCVCADGKVCESLPGKGINMGISVALLLTGFMAVKVVL